MTVLGAVRVRRIGYRAGAGGVPALLPADAVLNLPRRRYSWGLQQLAVLFTQAGSYGQARQFVRAATGVSIGKRQLEQITAEAAADAAGFDPALPRGQQAGPLALSPDAKRVAMLPGALRPGAKAPGQRARNFEKRRGTGEKGHKRMAQAGYVFDVAVPDEPRTPEQILARQPGQQPPQAPEAAGTWYTADITAGCAETIAALFGQAGRRDPGHARTWIALADGDNHQIRQIQDQAAARRVPVTILIDFIHVQEYLWKAAWCFHRPRDPAIEAWVTAQELDILHGRVAQVIARIKDLAAAHPPRPGSEHDKVIAKTLTYLQAKQPYLDYPRALASGWPDRHRRHRRRLPPPDQRPDGFQQSGSCGLCPLRCQTVLVRYGPAAYRHPRAGVFRGGEPGLPGVPGRASRRPGVLDRGRRRVRQGPCCRPVLVRSSLRP